MCHYSDDNYRKMEALLPKDKTSKQAIQRIKKYSRQYQEKEKELMKLFRDTITEYKNNE